MLLTIKLLGLIYLLTFLGNAVLPKKFNEKFAFHFFSSQVTFRLSEDGKYNASAQKIANKNNYIPTISHGFARTSTNLELAY